MPSDLSPNAPRPRLCHLVKWPDFDGYGFNLHAEKAKYGQFIGKVDEGSPAESAGMKEGDRIIEVNGVNVSNENHKQVVERIKAIPSETKLLVVDLETDKYYKNKKIVVKSSMSNVLYIKTALRKTSVSAITTTTPTVAAAADAGEKHSVNNGGNNGSVGGNSKNGSAGSQASEEEERRSQASSNASDWESLNQEGEKVSRNGSNLSTPPIGRSEEETRSTSSTESPQRTMTPTNGTNAPLQRSISAENSTNNAGGLNLNMTASQMRALLASKKKYDPKKDTLDLKKKHAIIQDL